MSNRALLLLALLATACSSSSSSSDGGSAATPCNQNPWECPSTQTCWPQTQSSYACLNAGPGTLGAACQNTAGTPTCGAGLACFQAFGGSAGSCVAYCSTTDPSHACSGSEVCETAALGGTGGPEFSVCIPQATGGGDGGTEASQGDAGAADSGSASDSATGG
jgi:hypothetical protein